MPSTQVSRTSFSAGSISPRLMGRTEIDQFRQGLIDCRNMVATVEGSIARRPGEEYLGDAKYPDQPVVFLDFIVSPSQTYVIEAGPLYFRFWAKDGQVLNAGVPLELVTPYTAEDLEDLQIAQDGDVGYVTHVNHEPRELTRTALNNFTLGTMTFLQGRAPLGPVNVDASKTITLSGVWPAITATASAAAFVPDDVGRVLFARNTTEKRAVYMTITGYTSPTVVSCNGTFSTVGVPSSALSEWAMGFLSPGYGCRCATIHEGRLWLAGFRRQADALVGSVSGSFNNFESLSPDLTAVSAVNNDKAITRRASAGGVAPIYWMASTLEQLVVGSADGQYLVTSGITGILTPLEARVIRATGRPQGKAKAVVVDGQVYFVQRGGTRTRRLELEAENGSYTTTDLSLLSSHLSIRGIRKLAYQQEPWSVMWGLMADGSLTGWTFERDRAVLGAHRHIFGGDLIGQPAQCIAMSVLPGENSRPNLDPIAGREGSGGVHATDTSWSFENAALSADWTISPAASFASAPAALGTTPAAGAFLAFSSRDAAAGPGVASLSRVVSLSTVSFWSNTLTDAGRARAEGRVSLFIPPRGDYGASNLVLAIEPLDAADVPIPYGYAGTAEGWPVVLADQPHGQWLALPFRSALLPPGTRKVRFSLTLNSDTIQRHAIALDDARLNVRQVAVREDLPPGLNEDRVMVCVRRTIAGQQVQQIGYLGPSAVPPLPDESEAQVVERQPRVCYLDASLVVDESLPLAWAADDGTAMRFGLAAPSALPAGTEVALHDLLWRQGSDLSTALADETVYLLDASNAPAGFRVSRTAGGAAITLADLGLDRFALWDTLILERQPVLNRRISAIGNLQHLESERVSALVDGREISNLRVENGTLTLPEAGSVVRIGIPYTSRMETTPISMGDPATNSFIGSPTKLPRATFRLLYSAGVVRVGTPAGVEPHDLISWAVPASQAPPFFTGDTPARTMKTSAVSLPTVVIETESAYPLEVLSFTTAADVQGL